MKSIYSSEKWVYIPYLNVVFQIGMVVVSFLATLVQRSQNQLFPAWGLAQSLASLLANLFLLLTAFVLYKLFVKRSESTAKTGLLLVSLGFLVLFVGQILFFRSSDQLAQIVLGTAYLPKGIGFFILGRIAKKTKDFPTPTSFFIQASGLALIIFAVGYVLAISLQPLSQSGLGPVLIGVFRLLQNAAPHFIFGNRGMEYSAGQVP